MPKQKDLKRLVRTRMQKTGEAYSAARLQLVNKKQPAPAAAPPAAPQPLPDYAALAGMADAKVVEKTGRSWAEWVALLDEQRAAEMKHADIAKYVSSLGTPSWWSQTVTVGYERIRGLRAKGQRRDGGYSVSKSRTFPVPIETLFAAFANARTRARWLKVKVTVRSASPGKSMRILWDDQTVVLLGFLPKGESKSTVAVEHQKLPDKEAADAMKNAWAEHFDGLAELLTGVH